MAHVFECGKAALAEPVAAWSPGTARLARREIKIKVNPIFLRALLATLPLLGLTLSVKSGFLYAAVVTTLFLLTALIFLTIRPVLPKILQRLSCFLLVWVLGVIGAQLFSLSPLALVSLSILPPPEFFRRLKNWNRLTEKIFLLAFSFGALLAGHGIFAGLLGREMGLGLFQFPAGSYFFMGLVLPFLRKK